MERGCLVLLRLGLHTQKDVRRRTRLMAQLGRARSEPRQAWGERTISASIACSVEGAVSKGARGGRGRG